MPRAIGACHPPRQIRQEAKYYTKRQLSPLHRRGSSVVVIFRGVSRRCAAHPAISRRAGALSHHDDAPCPTIAEVINLFRPAADDVWLRVDRFRRRTLHAFCRGYSQRNRGSHFFGEFKYALRWLLSGGGRGRIGGCCAGWASWRRRCRHGFGFTLTIAGAGGWIAASVGGRGCDTAAGGRGDSCSCRSVFTRAICLRAVCSRAICSRAVCSRAACSRAVCSRAVCSRAVCSRAVCSRAVCSRAVCSRAICSRAICSRAICSRATAHVPSAHVPSAHVPSAHVPSAHVPSAHVPSARVAAARVPAARVPPARVPPAREHFARAARLKPWAQLPLLSPGSRQPIQHPLFQLAVWEISARQLSGSGDRYRAMSAPRRGFRGAVRRRRF